MKDFKGKTAVVTGAARGIGYAFCEELARRGCNIVMADIDITACRDSAAKIEAMGAKVLPIRCDVTEYDDIVDMKDAAVEKFGSVELLFNNAGVTALGDIVNMPIVDFDFCVKTNLYSCYYGMRVFIPEMAKHKKECHIINTASWAGLYSDPGMPAYYAAKHAVIGISESTYFSMLLLNANEGTDINLTVLVPGMVRTDIAHCDDRRPAKFAIDPNNAYYQSEQYKINRKTSENNTGQHAQDPREVSDITFRAIEDKKLFAVCREGLVKFLEDRVKVIKGEMDYEIRGYVGHNR